MQEALTNDRVHVEPYHSGLWCLSCCHPVIISKAMFNSLKCRDLGASTSSQIANFVNL